MHSRPRQSMIGRAGECGGLPRRRLLQGAGALGLAAILRPTAVFAERDDDNERLGPFGPWSTPRNLGAVINQSRTTDLNTHPGISKNGLSLYISSTRPGGVNGANIGSNPYAPNFSADGHLLFFSSLRPGGSGSSDMYVSLRSNKHDDFAWQEPLNLGPVINSPQADDAPTYFEDEATGIITMYFASTRPAGSNEHIYASTLGDDGTFGAAVLVPELSSTSNETRTSIRRDGLEFFLASTRPNGLIGKNDIWVSTRDSTLDPWSMSINLGPTVNFAGEITGAPALSWDGTTLYCYSTRPSPPHFGVRDLYVATREKLRKHERRDESDHQRS